jgi:RNA polymerase sigma-70 factor, ECF subfamily
MSRTMHMVERSCRQPGVRDLRPCFPRKTVDPDAALVEQLRRPDAGAVEALVAAYGGRIYRLARRITRNALDAEEVVQDALWTASRRIDTFRGEAAFGSWLYRIAANTANQKARGRWSKRSEVSWYDIDPSFDAQGQHLEAAIDWSRDLKDPAIEGELKAMLWGAIDELPADYRTILLLHDVEGLSNPEIAETLQIKLSTVKARLHRTRLVLRKQLAEYMGGTLRIAQVFTPMDQSRNVVTVDRGRSGDDANR